MGKSVMNWLKNDCPLVSDVCELASETVELGQALVDDPKLVGEAFCYAVDGHDDKAEKRIVANPEISAGLVSELRNIGTTGMGRVISDVHVGMIKLNSATRNVGTLDVASFDEMLNEFGNASVEIGNQIESAVDKIVTYQNTGLGSKILGNTLMGVSKFSEGAFTVVENVVDAGLTLVGGTVSLTEKVLGGDGKNAVTEIISDGVKKRTVSDFFEATGCWDCYENDFGSVSRDSAFASTSYVGGQVGAYVVGGAMLSEAGGAMGTGLTGAKAGVQKTLTNSVLNQTVLAGVTGMGSGSENYLNTHEDATMAGALGMGTLQGAEQAAVAYGMGKLTEAAGRADAKKGYNSAADSLDDATRAETKAQQVFDDAQAREIELAEKIKTDSSPETIKAYEDAQLATKKASLELDTAKANKALAETKLNKYGSAKDMAESERILEENKSAIKERNAEFKEALKDEKLAQKNALDAKSEAIEKGVKNSDLTRMEQMDAAELKADATRIEGELSSKKAAIKTTEERIAEIKSENAEIRAKGGEPSPENIKELNTLESNLKEAKADVTQLEGQKQFNDSLRYEKTTNKELRDIASEKAALQDERVEIKQDLKEATNKYKQAQSEAETQRAIDKHKAHVEARELKNLKKEYSQMQKEGAEAYKNAPKETQAELTDIDNNLRSEISGKEAELRKIDGDIDAYKADNMMHDEAGIPRDTETVKNLNEANARKATLENELNDLNGQRKANTEKFIERQKFDEGVKARTDKLNEIENFKIDESYKNVEQGAYKNELDYRDLEYRELESFKKPDGIKDTATHLENAKIAGKNTVTGVTNLGTATVATAKVTAPYGPHAVINSGVRDNEIVNRNAISGIEYDSNGVPKVGSTINSGITGNNNTTPTGNVPENRDLRNDFNNNNNNVIHTPGDTSNQNTSSNTNNDGFGGTTGNNGGSGSQYSTTSQSTSYNPTSTSTTTTTTPASTPTNTSTNTSTDTPTITPINDTTPTTTKDTVIVNPTTPNGGGDVYTTNDNPGGTTSHSGGGYSRSGGYTGTQDYISTPGSSDSSSTIKNSAVKGATSIDDIVKGSKYTKIPTSQTPITQKNSGGLGSVIPIAAGLSAAAAAGIGAKAYLDHKKNNENDDADEEFNVEDDNFETEEWNGDENNIEIDYDDSSDTQTEQYLDDDEEDFNSYESEPEEKYGARTNEELADLQ